MPHDQAVFWIGAGVSFAVALIKSALKLLGR